MERLTTKIEDKNFIPTALCSTGRDGEVDDIDGCKEYCDQCKEECSECAIQKCFNKLAEYENLEDKGLLKVLPCGIGADIYYIPSKVNFRLNVLNHHEENNRVYHQNVRRITYIKNGWYLECDKDIEYGTGGILVDRKYRKTWFLTPEEAEQMLKEMESK